MALLILNFNRILRRRKKIQVVLGVLLRVNPESGGCISDFRQSVFYFRAHAFHNCIVGEVRKKQSENRRVHTLLAKQNRKISILYITIGLTFDVVIIRIRLDYQE